MLRPGAERVARLGGLHEFARWPHPILTDSGGFQVMSLSQLRKLDEKGVTFRSHIDGAALRDDAGALDRDPGPARFRHPDAARRMRRAAGRSEARSSAPWNCRCAGPSAARRRSATSPARRCSASSRAATCRRLRVRSAQALTAMDLKGYAVGGLAVGEPQAVMLDMLDITCPRTAGRKAALSDGRRHAGRHPEIGGARHRHVRLRDADARRPPRPRLYPARQGQSAQRPPCRRSAPARRGERLPGRARLFARLSAPSGEVAGGAGRHAADLEQPCLLSDMR